MIEDWYRHHQTEDLSQFLCADHVLKGKDASKSWRCQGQRRHAREGRGASPGHGEPCFFLRAPSAPLLPRLPGREVDGQEG